MGGHVPLAPTPFVASPASVVEPAPRPWGPRTGPAPTNSSGSLGIYVRAAALLLAGAGALYAWLVLKGSTGTIVTHALGSAAIGAVAVLALALLFQVLKIAFKVLIWTLKVTAVLVVIWVLFTWVRHSASGPTSPASVTAPTPVLPRPKLTI